MQKWDGRAHSQAEIEDWEGKMIQIEVGRANTAEREDLRAELVRKVLALKNEWQPGIRDWKRYMARALRNERVSWIRKWIIKEKKHVNIIESKTHSEDFPTGGVILSAQHRDLNDEIAVAKACKELRPEQRLLLRTLDEADGNQALAARRLGIHRNTLRYRLRIIQRIFTRHGF